MTFSRLAIFLRRTSELASRISWRRFSESSHDVDRLSSLRIGLRAHLGDELAAVFLDRFAVLALGQAALYTSAASRLDR